MQPADGLVETRRNPETGTRKSKIEKVKENIDSFLPIKSIDKTSPQNNVPQKSLMLITDLVTESPAKRPETL